MCYFIVLFCKYQYLSHANSSKLWVVCFRLQKVAQSGEKNLGKVTWLQSHITAQPHIWKRRFRFPPITLLCLRVRMIRSLLTSWVSKSNQRRASERGSDNKMRDRGHFYLQYWTVVEVICAGSALERGEGHVSSGEGWDVAKLICAQSLLLVVACADKAAVHLAVGLLAGAAVVLVGNPGPILTGALVDGKALRTAGVEFQTHISDVESLAWKKTEGNMNTSSLLFHKTHRKQ